MTSAQANVPYTASRFIPFGRKMAGVDHDPSLYRDENWTIISDESHFGAVHQNRDEFRRAYDDFNEPIEVEAYTNGTTVVLSSGHDCSSRNVLYTHAFSEGPVSQVLMMAPNCGSVDIPAEQRKLQDRKMTYLVCLRNTQEQIDFFDLENGESFVSKTPFKLEKAWPLPRGGLLVQRSVVDGATSIYSLFQPMAIYHPVLFEPMTDQIRRSCDNTIVIVTAIHEEEFLFVYDEREKAHCIVTAQKVNEPAVADVKFRSVLQTEQGDENRVYVKPEAPTMCLKQVWKENLRSSSAASKAFFVYGPVSSFGSIVYLIPAEQLVRQTEFKKTLGGNLSENPASTVEHRNIVDIAHINCLNAIAFLTEVDFSQRILVRWPNNELLWTVDVSSTLKSFDIDESEGETKLESSDGLSLIIKKGLNALRLKFLPLARNNTVLRCLNALVYSIGSDNASSLLAHYFSCLPRNTSEDEFKYLFDCIFEKCEEVDEQDKKLRPIGSGRDVCWKFMLKHCRVHSEFARTFPEIDETLTNESESSQVKQTSVRRCLSDYILPKQTPELFHYLALIDQDVALNQFRQNDRKLLLPIVRTLSKYLSFVEMTEYYNDLIAGFGLNPEERTVLKLKIEFPRFLRSREYRLLPWVTSILSLHNPVSQFYYVRSFHLIIDQFLTMLACLYPNGRFLSFLQHAGLNLKEVFKKKGEKEPIALFRLIKTDFALVSSPILTIGIHEALAWLSETCGRNEGDQTIDLKWVKFCGRYDLVKFFSKEKDRNLLEYDPETNLHTHEDVSKCEGVDDSDELAYLMVGFSKDIWPNDLRIREVRRLLTAVPSSSLNLSVFVGRGMFTLFSRERRIPDKIVMLSLVTDQQSRWARFHRGVSTALAIAPAACTDSYVQHSFFRTNFMLETESQTGSVSVRLEEMNPERCGLLFGFGLAGLLSNISPAVIYNLLLVASGDISMANPPISSSKPSRNELCTVGILLAYAASLHHSCNQLCLRTLLVHIGSCVEEAGNLQRGIEPVLEVNPMCQMAALVGLGLLYAESNDSRAANILGDEIGNWPLVQTDSGYQLIEHQMAHSISAGIALGLVHLGQGWNAKSGVIGVLKDYCTACNRIPVPMWSIGHQVNMGKRANRALLTTPAAAIALGLIFMGTNDLEFAESVLEKNSQNPRPDVFMFKIIAYWLIRINSLEPTVEFYEASISNQSSEAGMYGEVAFAFVMGIRFAGTRNWQLARYFLFRNQAVIEDSEKELLRLVSLMSAALIMAGTGCLPIIKLTRFLLKRYPKRFRVGQVVNMALGITMLGAGKLSFRQDNFSKACLVAAFLPNFAASVDDNRFYPQFLRHLYVLAVESRLLRFRSKNLSKTDDDDEEAYCPLYCDVDIEMRGKLSRPIRWVRVRACHLPVLEEIRLIRIRSPQHWTVNILLPDQIEELRRVLGSPPGHLGPLGYYTLERREIHKDSADPIAANDSLIPRTDKIPLPATIVTSLDYLNTENYFHLTCDSVAAMRLMFIYVRSRPKPLAFDYADLMRFERKFEASLKRFIEKAKKEPALYRKAAALERSYYIAFPALATPERTSGQQTPSNGGAGGGSRQ